VVYGTGRIDASGRVGDRSISAALGWGSGDRLTLTAEASMVVVRRDPHGMAILPASRCIVIPAALRRRCGLTAGDLVLLAARPGQDMLAAYRSLWSIRPSAPISRSLAAKEASNDRRHERVRASGRRGGAPAARADGPIPAGPGRCPSPAAGAADLHEYIPVVSAAVTTGTRRAYGSYWNRVLEHWGDRRLDEPTHAEDDGLITEADNPARKVDKPRRLPSTRRAVADTRLAEINQVAAATGNDPELDTMLLRLHTETACRRGGALALRPEDLDRGQCLILLREKGETVRWQPVSPTLMARLVQHGQQRHAPPDGQLLRYVSGQPISSRRYDHLWVRIGKQLPWVRTQQISMHWLRHTTLTWVDHECRAVKQAASPPGAVSRLPPRAPGRTGDHHPAQAPPQRQPSPRPVVRDPAPGPAIIRHGP
jgi:integrase/recombinase XerC